MPPVGNSLNTLNIPELQTGVILRGTNYLELWCPHRLNDNHSDTWGAVGLLDRLGHNGYVINVAGNAKGLNDSIVSTAVTSQIPCMISFLT